MADKDLGRFHASIHGYVQGVGFRFFVFHHAVNLNLKGWVRNRFNGAVEVVAEGPKSALQSLLDLLSEGPPGADVADVSEEWQDFQNEFSEFTILTSG